MASGVQALTAGIVDGTSQPATAKVSANFRVTASGQPIGVLGDAITFNGLPTVSGTWLSSALRVTIGGTPAINQTSQGPTVLSVGTPGGPMTVMTPDMRVSVD